MEMARLAPEEAREGGPSAGHAWSAQPETAGHEEGRALQVAATRAVVFGIDPQLRPAAVVQLLRKAAWVPNLQPDADMTSLGVRPESAASVKRLVAVEQFPKQGSFGNVDIYDAVRYINRGGIGRCGWSHAGGWRNAPPEALVGALVLAGGQLTGWTVWQPAG